MKTVTLNIRHGGGKRVRGLVKYLLEQNPDTIVLTEYRENDSGRYIRSELSSNGFDFVEAATQKPRTNSVCIASRFPFTARMYPVLPERNAHRVMSAHFNEITIYGAYFPNKEAKIPVYDFFLQGRHAPISDSHMIIGDFNTGLHHIDEKGSVLPCAEHFQALCDYGYVDSWRSRNPEAREYSWYSNTGNGFRIDHLFSTPAADQRITDIYYDHTPRLTALTDHSALIVLDEYGNKCSQGAP